MQIEQKNCSERARVDVFAFVACYLVGGIHPSVNVSSAAEFILVALFCRSLFDRRASF